MTLSDREYRAMQSQLRRYGQRYFEIPLFRLLGMGIHGKEVLEIGCGSGYGAYLLDKLQPKSYIGLDVMKEQIESAKTDYPQYQFLLQDAIDLSQFADQSKDVVVIFGVLHHISNWRKAIDEIERVLLYGGHLFLEEPRSTEVRIFDRFFHWKHPDMDFSLKALETYLIEKGMRVANKLWTPLLTMYHIQKAG
jgi:ubiquinone/menaquinone biosynthesis C-methylase UbiE